MMIFFSSVYQFINVGMNAALICAALYVFYTLLVINQIITLTFAVDIFCHVMLLIFDQFLVIFFKSVGNYDF